MAIYTQAKPVNKRQPRPTLERLGELIELYSGNIPRLADDLGYKRNQVYRWIQDAPPELGDALMEKIADCRAVAKRAKRERQASFLSYVPPIDLRGLLSPYYRLPWEDLQDMEIRDILNDADEDPEAPKTLRKKLSWDDLRCELAGLLPDYNESNEPIPDTGYLGLEQLTVEINGIHYNGWHQHCLMAWVGLIDHSPLLDHYEDLPVVIDKIETADDHGRRLVRWVPIGSHIEASVRLLIKRLEKYL